MKITDLAAEQIAEKYKFVANIPVSKIETGSNGLYVIYFGNSYSVSVEFSGNQFIINEPLSILDPGPITPPIDLPPPIAGGFQTFTALSDPRYVSAIAFVI